MSSNCGAVPTNASRASSTRVTIVSAGSRRASRTIAARRLSPNSSPASFWASGTPSEQRTRQSPGLIATMVSS